jgi:tetratricopeptide (TPR) repeat protein
MMEDQALSYFSEKLPEQIANTLQHWKTSPNRLVIFNHLDDPSVLVDWAPRMKGVSIIVTSSHNVWPDGAVVQEIPELTTEDSLALLRLICSRLEKTPDDEIARLAERLNFHPLALSTAGCYLRERSRASARDYTSEIEKCMAAPEPAAVDWMNDDQANRTPELGAALLLSLRLLQQRGEREWIAWVTLNTMSFFAPSIPLPVPLLARLVIKNPENQHMIDRSLAWLYQLGLVSPSPAGPVLNACFSSLAQKAFPDARGLLTGIVETMLGFISSPQAESIPFWQSIPHLRALATHAEEAMIKQAGALWNRAGAMLFRAGENNEAREYLEHSLAINARLLGGERLETASAAAALGRTLSDLGDVHGAKAALEKAMAIYEKLYGPAYPEVANVASQLGQIEYDLGDLPAAKVLLERALTIHETGFGFGPNHPIVAQDADSLARVLRDMNDLQGAKVYFERALKVEENANGEFHPNIATRANNLGRVLYKLGELDSARECFERSLEILKITQGPENAALATALNNLGLVLQDLGSLEKARDCFERALQIDEKLYGSEHPNVARDANNLGSVYSSMGKLTAARDCFKRALEIDENLFGPSHANNAINANNLGRVLYNLGDLDGAKKAFERALEVDQKLHGNEHTRVGTDLNNLGTVLYEKGDLLEARAAFERALGIFLRHLDPEHPKITYAKKFLERVNRKISAS